MIARDIRDADGPSRRVPAGTDLTSACVSRPGPGGDGAQDAPGPRHQPEAGEPFVVPRCSRPEELRFAYLNLQGHPRGERMLHKLVGAGFVPSLVIEEASTLAVAGRDGQLEQLRQVTGFSPPPPTDALCAQRGIRHALVPDHNDTAVRRLLCEASVDIAVLGDTRVLRPEVIASVPFGIVNVHPGFLPDVRGNHPYIWAVIHGLPQGVTVHLIDDRIDRGPILLARELTVRQGTLLPQLIHTINELCADLVVEALTEVVHGRARARPQEQDQRLTFRAAPPVVRHAAARLLADRATGDRRQR